MSLLFAPDRVAWLVTAGSGNHEFARVFYHNGKYNVREGFSRIAGGIELLHAAVLDDGTLYLEWSRGHRTLHPRDWFQYTFAL